MASMESPLHKTMKSRVMKELMREGYDVIHEPLYPPMPLMTWSGYRPDLLGVREGDSLEEFVFVECETRPNTSRMNSKNFRSVKLQTKLNRSANLRRVLVIPRGKLGALDSRLRRAWEIWIASDEGFLKIPISNPHR